mgnify:CR=1 FL=1
MRSWPASAIETRNYTLSVQSVIKPIDQLSILGQNQRRPQLLTKIGAVVIKAVVHLTGVKCMHI